MPASAEYSEAGDNFNARRLVHEQLVNQELQRQQLGSEPHQQISIEEGIDAACHYVYDQQTDEPSNQP